MKFSDGSVSFIHCERSTCTCICIVLDCFLPFCYFKETLLLYSTTGTTSTAVPKPSQKPSDLFDDEENLFTSSTVQPAPAASVSEKPG